MTIFSFNNPTTFLSSITGTSSGSFTDAGVQFTLSISNGDGANSGFVGFGSLSFSNSGNGSPAADVFARDPVGAGMTKFTGNFSISVGAEFGTWFANGVALNLGNNIIASGAGGAGAITFTHSGGIQTLSITSITATVNCFLTGTGIATPLGEVTVETLQPGDRILTATGGETTVKWLGQQTITPRFAIPEKVNPICIRAGALGDSTPTRDLYITADHAIALDGVLYNAGALVNGTTITQVRDMPLDGFTYFHIETDAHELLLAEGVAAESFLDADWQSGFDNAADRDAATPIPEMDLPRITTARLLPGAIRDRLANRAGVRCAA